MHKEVIDWVLGSLEWWIEAQHRESYSVLEFGSLDINGSVRSVLQSGGQTYTGIDITWGPGVDVIADASVFRDITKYDIVVCCEVFEHTPKWPQIISNAYTNLHQGGLFIATMAGPGRHPHSAFDENPIRDFEYYENISAESLVPYLLEFPKWETDSLGADTRARAIK